MTVRQTSKGIQSRLVILVLGSAAAVTALVAAVGAVGEAMGAW